MDPERYAELVRQHHGAVYRVARRVVRSDADAQDVAQQVFLKVLEGRFDASGARSGQRLCWLAGREALQNIRQSRNRKRLESLMPRPHADRPAQDDLRAVRESVDALPDDLRAPLLLRFAEGLSFQAIGETLRFSESTAHTRVQRGLETLRKRLMQGGFAAAAAHCENALRDACPIEVPSGLEHQLLELGAGTAGAAATAPFAIQKLAAVLAIAATGVTAMAMLDGNGTERPTTNATVAVEPVRVTTEVDAHSSPAGAEARVEVAEHERRPPPLQDPETFVSRVIGRVVDRSSGLPVVAATVEVRSHQRDGKRPRYSQRIETDETGRFEIRVEVEPAHPGYVVSAWKPDWHGDRHDLELRTGENPPQRLELRRWAVDEDGEWSMPVLVVDAAGQPVAGAHLKSYRRQPDREHWLKHPLELQAKTNGEGRATLRGTHRGEKILFVEALNSGLRNQRTEVAITTQNPAEMTFVMTAGKRTRGRTVRVDNGSPVDGIWLEAHQDQAFVGRCLTDQDGSFEFTGLHDGPVRISGRSARMSPFYVDIPAGSEDNDLRLKERTDPRDHGLHLGEIHVRTIDAATGEPLPVLKHLVHLYWVGDDVQHWREVIPSILRPRIAQQVDIGFVQPPSPDVQLLSYRPGRFVVYARVPGYELAAAGPFDTRQNQLHRVELRLQPE